MLRLLAPREGGVYLLRDIRQFLPREHTFVGCSDVSPTLVLLLWLKPRVTAVTRAALREELLPAVTCVQPLSWENTCASTSIRIASDTLGSVARNYWSGSTP